MDAFAQHVGKSRFARAVLGCEPSCAHKLCMRQPLTVWSLCLLLCSTCSPNALGCLECRTLVNCWEATAAHFCHDSTPGSFLCRTGRLATGLLNRWTRLCLGYLTHGWSQRAPALGSHAVPDCTTWECQLVLVASLQLLPFLRRQRPRCLVQRTVRARLRMSTAAVVRQYSVSTSLQLTRLRSGSQVLCSGP